jgi:hypothetical protein
MAPNQHPATCADCGQPIVGTPIVLSRTEVVCESCWPFLLKPIPTEEPQAGAGIDAIHDHLSAMLPPSQKIA